MSTPWPPAAPSASASPGATRVLVVDDDPQVAAVLSSYLTGQGMEVVLADSAAGLRAALSQGVFHVVLLDLGLSDADGYDALRELRARWSGALLIISGRGDAAERAISLELGADDFVAKPFDLRELLARIHSVRRRLLAPTVAPVPVAYALDGLRIDPRAQDAYGREGELLNLTQSEFELLQALATAPRGPVTRDVLLTAVHGRYSGPFDRSVDMQVARLRRKIERDPTTPRLIRSVRGKGYMLGVEPTAL